MVKKKCVKTKDKKKYVQKKDKKKLCPKCNGRVFNATIICKLIHKNISCDHKFVSLRQIKRLNESMKAIKILKENLPKINNTNIYVIKKITSGLITVNEDIIRLNKLAEKYDMGCLSPYKIKKDKELFISTKHVIKTLIF